MCLQAFVTALHAISVHNLMYIPNSVIHKIGNWDQRNKPVDSIAGIGINEINP